MVKKLRKFVRKFARKVGAAGDVVGKSEMGTQICTTLKKIWQHERLRLYLTTGRRPVEV
jgi:hypothetical protein